MSVSLSEERDRIQRQVEELEQSLSVTHTELELLSSETGDESGSDDTENEGPHKYRKTNACVQSAGGLLAHREKIQQEIQNLENVLGPQSPMCDDDEDDDVSSNESELGLSLSVDSCLQMNLVYQQVVQETLDRLETLLTHNQRQQKELVSQLSGPIKEPSREQPAPSSYQQPITMYLGRFLKPYFKDKLTGLGPPANQETKEKASRMTGCLDDRKLKIKRWESWQKTLLIHSVTRDSLRRLIQPKLSRVDYLSQKLSSAEETDRQQLREQINSLERDIDLLRGKKEEELIGDRYEDHDWAKISNIDFEGTKDAEDICCFWQNFLHPAIRKSGWSQEEVQQLKEISRRHGERHWETIAQELGTGRTAFMCLQTFQRFVSDSLRRSSWTPAEDALLRELVDKMRIGNFVPYTQMSYFMEGRDPAQLIYRWNQVLDPSLKKGLWTKEEDQLLLRAVSHHGEKNWWRIRLEVPGRTDSACRDRYHDCLKAGTKRGAFDQQERELLLQLVEKHGVGRWAKIAAEIPHRYDAQCLREWRKLSRPPPPQKHAKAKKTQRSKGEGKKNLPPVRRRMRRKLMTVKEESSEEEQEEMVVEYMDSDEEEKKKKKVMKVKRAEEEVEEEVKEYIVPPIQEWIPSEKAQLFSFLSFRPVALPSSADSSGEELVRSTILGRFGRSVIIGPSPRELPWEERHSSSTMMMVSSDQLRTHLYRHVHRCNNQSSQRKGQAQTAARHRRGRLMDTGLDYELQAALTPWIGNLLVPAKTKLMAADALREQGEKTQLSSTPVFLLLLQTMNVDTMGCKEMIEQRRSRATLLTLPPAPPPAQRNPKTIAAMLQQRRMKEEELQQHELILKQLQVLQPPRPPPPRPPQSHCGVPQISPMSLSQAVFIPHPVPPSSFSTFPSSPHRPPPGGSQVSVISMVKDAAPTSPALFHQQGVCLGSTLANQHAAPSTVSTPCPSPCSPTHHLPRGRVPTKADKQEVVCSSQKEVGCGGAGGAYGVVVEQGWRGRAPQDATTTKTEAKRKTETLPPPQTAVLTPPPVSTSLSFGTNLIPAPPTSLSANQAPDHDYSLIHSRPSPKQPNPMCHKYAPNIPPKGQRKRKRMRGRGQDTVTSSQDDAGRTGDPVGGACTSSPEGKRVRKLSQKARELQEAKAEAKKKKERTTSSSPPYKKRPCVSCPKQEDVVQLDTQLPGLHLLPGQSMWVMTPGGLVQLAEAPPHGLQLVLVPGSSHPPPSVSIVSRPVATPPLQLVSGSWQTPSPRPAAMSVPVHEQPGPLMTPPTPKTLPPTFVLQPVQNPPPSSSPCPPCLPQLPPKLFLPYEGTIRADPAEPPPLRREVLQFDPSLMFLEPRAEVHDWLCGQGGVAVPGAGVALPYLPPFVSSLSTLSALLRAKKSLTKSSLQLLNQGSELRPRPTRPDGSTDRTSGLPPPDMPDSTSDLRSVGDQPAPSVSCDAPQEEEKEEIMTAVRQLVTRRFSGNPAYQLLKARFLSCFTLPALLATIQPITGKTVPPPTPQEEEKEEDEEETELKNIKERGRRRRAERSLLLCDESGPPASHFSGINTNTAPQTRPDR